MNKIIIWIIAGLSVGKTTQNKKLLHSLKDAKRVYHKSFEGSTFYAFTSYGLICSLGEINNSQCCGLDRVSSKLKNEGVRYSIEKAFEVCDIVIVESIMSSSKWIEFLGKFDAELFIIHLDISFEENVRRLKWRKYSKERITMGRGLDEGYLEEELTDANYEFIRKTRMQYKNIFERERDECGEHHYLNIDGARKPEEINEKILKFIYNNI